MIRKPTSQLVAELIWFVSGALCIGYGSDSMVGLGALFLALGLWDIGDRW